MHTPWSESTTSILLQMGNPSIAEHSLLFFKTGKGEYGEGDKFIGIRVPDLRRLAKQYRNVALCDLKALLDSEWHEARLLVLIILADQFKKSKPGLQKAIYDLYLSNTHRINGWDLVDCSAHHIVGGYLSEKNRDILHSLADSSSLWERRIAMMATFTFIRMNQFDDTITMATKLLNDKEDLIHKVTGWMLREVGKRDKVLLVEFLDKYVHKMPRTMLRYAIEKLTSEERKQYLSR